MPKGDPKLSVRIKGDGTWDADVGGCPLTQREYELIRFAAISGLRLLKEMSDGIRDEWLDSICNGKSPLPVHSKTKEGR